MPAPAPQTMTHHWDEQGDTAQKEEANQQSLGDLSKLSGLARRWRHATRVEQKDAIERVEPVATRDQYLAIA